MVPSEEWPSKRIPQGGLWAPKNVPYSPETHKFLKLLMEEQKMTMRQRSKIQSYLKSGESLPTDINDPCYTPKSATSNRVKARPRTPRLRSLSDIIKSGAYDIEKPPSRPIVNRDKVIEHLQNTMMGYKQGDYKTYLRGKFAKQAKPKREEKPGPQHRLDELMNEVKERMDWLEDMAKIGQDKPHREVIKQQIADKLRQIKALKKALVDLPSICSQSSNSNKSESSSCKTA